MTNGPAVYGLHDDGRTKITVYADKHDDGLLTKKWPIMVHAHVSLGYFLLLEAATVDASPDGLSAADAYTNGLPATVTSLDGLPATATCPN
ncbi:hypothetical protein ACFX14_011872 [Malus domestica]